MQNILHIIPPTKSLSLHFKNINIVKSSVDHQTSNLLAYMQGSDYKVAFTPVHLMFLELDTYHWHLDFKLLDESNNVNTP